MKKLEISNSEAALVAINRETSRSEEARYHHRLHGVLLVINGLSCQQVAEVLGENRRTVQRWVKSFETHGLDGLREDERPGRPALLDEREWESLKLDLSRGPQSFGYEPGRWNGKKLSEHLNLKYTITLGVRQCQRILRHLPRGLRIPRG